MNAFRTSLRGWAQATEKAVFSDRAYLAFGIVLVAYVFLGSLDLYVTNVYADYWEHLAFMNAFAKDFLRPDNPYLLQNFPLYMYSPYHLFWGAVARLFDLNALFLSPLIGAANILLFLLAARLFAERILGDGKAALLLVLALLFFWLDPWPWSGFYHFGLLPLTAVYPYWFAFPAALAVISLYPRRTRALSLFFVPVTSIVILAHPITGAFLVTSLTIIPVVEAWNRRRAYPLVWIAVPVVAFALAALWPYSSLVKEIFAAGQSAQGYNRGYALFYKKLPIRLFPALPGLIYVYLSLKKRRFDFITVGFMAFAAIYVADYFLVKSLAVARLVVYVVFFLQAALVMATMESRRRLRPLLVSAIVLVAVGSSLIQFRESVRYIGVIRDVTTHSDIGYHSNMRLYRDYRAAFARFLSKDDVVWARSYDSLMLPVFLACSIVNKQWPPNPYLPPDYISARVADERAFYRDTTTPERRRSILRKYRVTHVLVSDSDTRFLAGMRDRVRLLASARGKSLYRLTSGGNARRL